MNERLNSFIAKPGQDIVIKQTQEGILVSLKENIRREKPENFLKKDKTSGSWTVGCRKKVRSFYQSFIDNTASQYFEDAVEPQDPDTKEAEFIDHLQKGKEKGVSAFEVLSLARSVIAESNPAEVKMGEKSSLACDFLEKVTDCVFAIWPEESID